MRGEFIVFDKGLKQRWLQRGKGSCNAALRVNIVLEVFHVHPSKFSFREAQRKLLIQSRLAASGEQSRDYGPIDVDGLNSAGVGPLWRVIHFSAVKDQGKDKGYERSEVRINPSVSIRSL